MNEEVVFFFYTPMASRLRKLRAVVRSPALLQTPRSLQHCLPLVTNSRSEEAEDSVREDAEEEESFKANAP